MCPMNYAFEKKMYVPCLKRMKNHPVLILYIEKKTPVSLLFRPVPVLVNYCTTP